jgi:ubiquitin-conjugating enzyme E2 H
MSQKRKERDFKKLIMSGYQAEYEDSSQENIIIEFEGPKDTLYENGKWRLRVYLPSNYPYKSPSIGFLNKIFHPNVDFQFYKKLRIDMPRRN